MKPSPCQGCPLIAADGPVWGVGPKPAQIMLVGEAPGQEELARHEPFVGPSGRILNLALKAAGIVRANCYITNSVKCVAWDHKPTPRELEFCRKAWLVGEIAEVKPNVIVAIGQYALETLLPDGVDRKILSWRGAILEAMGEDHSNGSSSVGDANVERPCAAEIRPGESGSGSVVGSGSAEAG